VKASLSSRPRAVFLYLPNRYPVNEEYGSSGLYNVMHFGESPSFGETNHLHLQDRSRSLLLASSAYLFGKVTVSVLTSFHKGKQGVKVQENRQLKQNTEVFNFLRTECSW
jgi:hypothetical protein